MTETAVDWLCNEWLYIDQEFDMKLIDKKTYWERLKSVQEQAKAMEKKYLEQFYNQGYTQCSVEDLKHKSRDRFVDAEDYYNKTFKSE